MSLPLYYCTRKLHKLRGVFCPCLPLVSLPESCSRPLFRPPSCCLPVLQPPGPPCCLVSASAHAGGSPWSGSLSSHSNFIRMVAQIPPRCLFSLIKSSMNIQNSTAFHSLCFPPLCVFHSPYCLINTYTVKPCIASNSFCECSAR